MFAKTLALLQTVKSDEKGVTALEYGLIASAAVAILLTAFNAFYGAISGLFASIAGQI